MTAIVVRGNHGIEESIWVTQVSSGRSQTSLDTLKSASLLTQRSFQGTWEDEGKW